MLIGVGALLLLGTAGCGEEDSKTQLNPAGPPMVRQVFMDERVPVDTDGDGTPDGERTRTQLAFGTHPDIPLDDDPQDGVANALALNNKVRIIIDELLDGSTLEQIGCADGTFVDIPSGTTPDDVADCSGIDRRNCTAVCTQLGPDNQPIGILDADEDGAADAFRFKEGIVDIVCDGEVMPLIYDGMTKTFWNPSGNQQIPAGAVGVSGIGPAIVLIPEGMRTGASCGIEIDDSVVDKEGNSVCAPPNGDVDQSCPGNGDTSLIDFGTQVFALVGAAPGDGQQFVKLDTKILLQFNLDVEASTVPTNVELSNAGGPVAKTVMLEADNAIVSVLPDALMTPETEYTLDITGGTNGVTEIFGGGLAEDIQIVFTTCLAEGSECAARSNCCEGDCTDPGDGTPVCTAPPPMPDADVPDADTTPDADIPDAGTPDA